MNEEKNLSEYFYQNFKAWKEEVQFRSTDLFNSFYFQNIVNMGKDAIPFIYEEIKKQPGHLVHALDMICSNVIKYDGYVSLEMACNKWLSILERLVGKR